MFIIAYVINCQEKADQTIFKKITKLFFQGKKTPNFSKLLDGIKTYIQLMKFRKFVLKSYPSANFPQDLSCFQLKTDAQIDDNNIPEGFALIQVYWVSLDPLLRTWISGAKSYLDPVKPGSSIPGFGIARLMKISRSAKKKTFMEVGDWVIGMLEWSEYVLIDYKTIQKLPVDLQEQSFKFLTIYGPTGLTSMLSIKQEILPFKIWNKKENRHKTKEELNIVISSVAGGVGLSLTEYLAKMGFKNIYGIAGSDEKCKIAKELGCKDTINYKKYYVGKQFRYKDFERDTKKMMNGEEIDLYYENVGQEMLSSMLKLMANHSKIVMCGALATYNNWVQKRGVKNMENIILKRIEMKGILYYNVDTNLFANAVMEMMSLQVKGVDVVIKGMEKLPEVYRDMIDGKFIGKPVVQLVDYFKKCE